jgi:uncharacterized delta-60 repeat protein
MRSGTFVRALLAFGSAVAVLCATPLTAFAAAGDLDPDFGGGDGQVVTTFPQGRAALQALAVQKDGKIVAGGSVNLTDTNQAFALARYKPGGQLDPTFGDNGRVVTDFTAGNDVAEGLVVLGNGSIVAAGYTSTMFAAARYTKDGHLDHSFSGDGKIVINFGADFDGAYDIARAPGGKVVLVGEKEPAGGGGTFALARLTSTGTLDDTFGGDGKVITAFPGFVATGEDLLVHDDGSILVSGDLFSANPVQVGLAAYRPNGTLDPAFGDEGTKTLDPGSMFPRGMVELGSGKIVLAGSIGGGHYDLAVLRLKPGGDPDQTFGPGGLVTHDLGKSAYVEDLRRAGTKLVLAVGLDVPENVNDRMAAVRLTANGSLDLGFGDQGVAKSTLQQGFAQAVAIQQDGRILIGGSSSTDTNNRMAIARFLAT